MYMCVYVYVRVYDKETFIFYVLFSNLLTYIRINFFLIFHNTNRKLKNVQIYEIQVVLHD